MAYDINDAFLAKLVYEVKRGRDEGKEYASPDQQTTWRVVLISPENTNGYQGALF